jgi:hypothetical protein
MCTCQNSTLPVSFQIGTYQSDFNRADEDSSLTIRSTQIDKEVNLCVCRGFYLSAKTKTALDVKVRRGGLGGLVFESNLTHPECNLIINADGTGIGIGDIRDTFRSYSEVRFDLKKSDMEVHFIPDAMGVPMMTFQFEIGYLPETTPAIEG